MPSSELYSRSIAACVLCLAFAGCGGRDKAKALPPLSADELASLTPSAADSLLAMAPAGAKIVVELDLKRLRDNRVVGGLVLAASGLIQKAAGFQAMRDADVALYCGYKLGSAQAESLFLVKSARLAELAGAAQVASNIVAVAAPAMRRRVRDVVAGKAQSIRSERKLMKIREQAVPAKASGASIRVVADWSFEDRLAVARLYNFDRVPTSVSIWGDVADDLAVVIVLGDESPKNAKELIESAKYALRRIAAEPWVRKLFLSYLSRHVSVEQKGRYVRLVLLIAPRSLRLLAKRLERTLQKYLRAAPAVKDAASKEAPAIRESALSQPPDRAESAPASAPAARRQSPAPFLESPLWHPSPTKRESL